MKTENEADLSFKPKTKRGLKVYNKVVGQTNPEEKANGCSKLFFSWVSSIASLGNKVSFKQHHHPQLSTSDMVENNYPLVDKFYKNPNISLLKAVWAAYKGMIICTLLIDLLKALLDSGVIL